MSVDVPELTNDDEIWEWAAALDDCEEALTLMERGLAQAEAERERLEDLRAALAESTPMTVSPTYPCPCSCRPDGPCGESLKGIELAWGECILCHGGDHWKPGDDDPAFDWPAILEDAGVS